MIHIPPFFGDQGGSTMGRDRYGLVSSSLFAFTISLFVLTRIDRALPK